MGSLRVRHDRVTSLSLFTFTHWRRKWQLTIMVCLENPRDGESGGLPSMGLHRVGHDRSDLAAAAAVPEVIHSKCGTSAKFKFFTIPWLILLFFF